MDELTPLLSKPRSPIPEATQVSCSEECRTNEMLSFLADDYKDNESDCHESSVVVGVNPTSTQQARMEELKLLKSRGLARKENVKMSPSERLFEISTNVLQKYPKETRKKHHLESMEYLQNPLSSQQARVEHQARMEEMKLLKLDSVSRRKSLGLSPGSNLSDAGSSPNVVEEGKRTVHLLESMEYLQNPLSSQQAKLEHQARMEEVKLLKLNGITKEKSQNLTPSEGITDIDSFHSSLKTLKEERNKQHLQSMDYLHKFQNNEIVLKKLRRQNDCAPVISPSPSQDGLSERRDSTELADYDGDCTSPQPCDGVVETDGLRHNSVESPSVISHTSDESKGDEHQNDVDHMDCTETLEKSDFHSTEEDYHSDIIVPDQDDSEAETNCDEDNMIMKDDAQSDTDVISYGEDNDKVNMVEHNSQEINQVIEPTKTSEKCSTISSSHKRNAPMSVDSQMVLSTSTRSQKYARGTTKSRIANNGRSKRATPKTQPRFNNYVYSYTRDRDASIDSHDSSRVTRDCGNRRVSDLSSQSSFESGFHGQPRRKPVRPESPRSPASNIVFNLGRPGSGRPGSGRPHSVTSHSSTTSKSTPVPGIKKNMKRD